MCRIEHMLLGQWRRHVAKLIVAVDDEQREQVLEALLPLQQWHVMQILIEMDGLPTAIQLLDPPLHEFLPDLADPAMHITMADKTDEIKVDDQQLMQTVLSLNVQSRCLAHPSYG